MQDAVVGVEGDRPSPVLEEAGEGEAVVVEGIHDRGDDEARRHLREIGGKEIEARIRERFP